MFRHTFCHRNQAKGELINAYITAVCKATFYCEFWDLDEALLDRLVCEVTIIKLQLCLLAKSEVTLKSAVRGPGR